MDQELLEGKKVLVVDDEPDVQETIEEILFMCDVETADSFDAAASMMEQDDFDIAVLDIDMNFFLKRCIGNCESRHFVIRNATVWMN